MKYKSWKVEQRRMNKFLRCVNKWVSCCLTPEISVHQVNRYYDEYDGMFYLISFVRGNCIRTKWIPEDLINEYVCGGLFDFIWLYGKDLRENVNFRELTFNNYEFLWGDCGYHAKFERTHRKGLTF